MPRNSTSNYRGRVPGSVNKEHKQPELRRPGLTKDEEARLQEYSEAVKNIRSGTDRSRGSISDYLNLVVRSKSHNALHANVLQMIREDSVLHEQLHTLFNEEEGNIIKLLSYTIRGWRAMLE